MSINSSHTWARLSKLGSAQLILISTLAVGCASDERQWGAASGSTRESVSANEAENIDSSTATGTEAGDTDQVDSMDDVEENCFGQCDSTEVSDTPFQTKPDAFGDSEFSIQLEESESDEVPSCLVGGVSFTSASLSLSGHAALANAWELASSASAGQIVLQLLRSGDDDGAQVAGAFYNASEVEAGFFTLGLGTDSEIFSYDAETQVVSYTFSQSFEVKFASDDDDDDETPVVEVAEAQVIGVLADDCSSLTEVEVSLLIPASQDGAAFGEETMAAALGSEGTTLAGTGAAAYELILTGTMAAGEER